MKILLVSPVGGPREQLPEQVDPGQCAPDVTLYRARVPFGPVSIETHTDEAYAALAVLETVVRHRGDFDAYVVTCFSDPGVWPAREVVQAPVVGIGEAAMLLASSLGRQFSLIGTVSRDVAVLAHLVERIGLRERLASIRPIDREIAGLKDADAHDEILEDLLATARTAITEDNAEVLCPACGSLAGFCSELQESVGVPVVDPVAAGVAWAQMQVRLGLSHSKQAMFAPVHPKGFCLSSETEGEGWVPFRAVPDLYQVGDGSSDRSEGDGDEERNMRC